VQDRPTALELLREVERFLQQEVAPGEEGARRFRAAVAANALRIVRRELEQADEHLLREWEVLDRLLGAEPLPPGRRAQEEALRRRVEEVCRRIRELLSFLWLLTRHKLQVNDPGWLERPRA
jgi:peptide subunit release factor 1 (eRF1)